MCLKELGVRLDGYQSGAMLLFRGTEMAHFTANWNQDEGYRYAFDHTTHESVRRATKDKEPYKEYEPPHFSEDDEEIRSEAGVKVEADPAGSTNVKDSQKKAKEPARGGKRPQRKTVKRSRSDDTDDESDDDEFKPEPRRKKRGKKGDEAKKDDEARSQQPRRSKRSPQPPRKQPDV